MRFGPRAEPHEAGDTDRMTPQPVKTVAISGASGLIGTALSRHLSGQGWQVRPMVRSVGAQSSVGAARPQGGGSIPWDPYGTLNPESLAGVDVVVHLAGAGVGDHRWTASYKDEIRNSRVAGTRTIARAIAGMDEPCSVFVSGSAIGFYGDTGSRVVDESSPQGEGFLADVVRDWESAADPAREAGVRTVHPRTGLVASREGGAWQRMLPLFKAGVGGRLGSGDQFWSVISLRDEVAALQFLIESDLSGPVNLVIPEAPTNREVTEAMGKALRRPVALPVPAFALKAVLGEFSVEVLGSTRVRPSVLLDAGFSWQDGSVSAVVASAIRE